MEISPVTNDEDEFRALLEAAPDAMVIVNQAGEIVLAIAVTAHARAEDRSRALSAGFQTYLSKPIEHARLVRAVKELGRRPRRAA